MTKDDLFAVIKKAGLIPVPVILQDAEDGDSIAFFEGDLEQFLVTAKAIGSSVVFVQDDPFQAEDFEYSPDEDEDGDEDAEDSYIDLTTVSTALAKFKKYLGQNYSFCLVAKGGIDDLRLIVDQNWVKDFENEWERAQGKILVERSKARNN
jgi:hypothetical protein